MSEIRDKTGLVCSRDHRNCTFDRRTPQSDYEVSENLWKDYEEHTISVFLYGRVNTTHKSSNNYVDFIKSGKNLDDIGTGIGITIYLGLVEETCWMQVAVFAQEYKLDETDKVWLVYKGFL